MATTKKGSKNPWIEALGKMRGMETPPPDVVALKGLTIPLITYEAISEYVYLARQPNPFLHAVLCNDLLGACQSANALDAAFMRDTVLFVYNHCPALCAGSQERVAEWMDRCMDHFRRVKS